MDSLIQDCELLNGLEEIPENIKSLVPFELDLITKLYSNDYSFTDQEFLLLADQLNYLCCKKLVDILTCIKYKNICVDSLNEDLQAKIKQIPIDKKIFYTYLRKNNLGMLKWIYYNVLNRISLKIAFNMSCTDKSIEIARW